ncbi:MAG: CaiB/BaiF CoA transferase family protein, partial [Pseudomonadales bacterium]
MSRQPLQGVRIVDLTHVWAGPLATRMLGDLGADIVKVEAPLARGSATVPAIGQGLWVGGEAGEDSWNRQSLFTKLNRSKRGVCVDLKVASGRETLLELIRVADVVIENFSANALERLGLGYETLSSINPDIIYVSMPGYGSSGPYSGLTAFGPSVEPMTGLGALMGYSKNEPRNTAMALVDAIGGVSGASAVVTALNHRKDTGRGGCIELSLHEAGVSFFGDFLVDHQLGAQCEPMGNAHPGYAPHGIYPSRGDDEWIAIACPSQETWRNLRSLTA